MRSFAALRFPQLIAAIAVAVLPLALTVFPGLLGGVPLPLRIVLILIFAGLAGPGLASSIRRSDQIAELVEPPLAQRDAERELAWRVAIRAVLTDPTSPLGECDLRLHVYDSDLELLVPIFPEEEGTRAWGPGRGVTGKAWELGEYVRATGPELAEGSYGLAPEQRRRYARLAVVAAMPVRNARGEVVAILSASSADPDEARLVTSEDGYTEHVLLAHTCARLLIDVLRYSGD